VRLNAEQYEIAMEAHRREADLQVSGQLQKENNRWWLYNATDLEIVERPSHIGQIAIDHQLELSLDDDDE
jgi:hypothetical protein